MKNKHVILSIFLASLMLIPTAYALPATTRPRNRQHIAFSDFAVAVNSTLQTPSAYPNYSTFSPYTTVQFTSYANNAKYTSLTGLGDDYLIYYNDGSPEVWNQNWIKTRLAQYNVKSVRLGFLFSDAPGAGKSGYGSMYNANKMNRVLDILSASGVKGILTLQNNGVSCKNYVGSWAWVNNWLSVTKQFKGDSRVAAFSIFGEPAHDNYYDTWATDGPLGPITDRRKLQQVFAYLIDAIHAIDPGRVVIYPLGQFSYNNANEWYNELNSLGIVDKQNVIFDIIHPYYFENDWDLGLTPIQKAQWYVNNWIAPSVKLFGADKCFVGETFAWSLSHHLQVQFLTEIINVFTDYNIGFQIWAYWSSPNQSWQNEAIVASNH